MVFLENVKGKIEKLRELPIGHKKVIFFIIIGLATIGLLFLEVRAVQRQLANTSGIPIFMDTMLFPFDEISQPIDEVKTIIAENPISFSEPTEEAKNFLTGIDSAAWEQYQNTTYQFSLRYPPGFTFEEKNSDELPHSPFSVNFTHHASADSKESPIYPTLAVKVISSNLSPEDYIKENLIREEFGITQDQIKSMIVNEHDARRLGFKITTPEVALIHVYTLLNLRKGSLLSMEYHQKDVSQQAFPADAMYEQFLASLIITQKQLQP